MSSIDREQFNVVAEKAVLVRVELPGSYTDPRDAFGELRALTTTAGARVVGELRQKRRTPRGRTYLGKGKVVELAALVEMTKATLVIFDNDLSPAQVRALEQETSCKIIDRSELILDIFANRATTHMAKLQVEIAQLEYTYPRLRAMWDHLGQVTGGAPVGIGTRGPGEQQLEIDRRLVQTRLKQLRRELEAMQQRKTREVADRNLEHFTVGLVGYTNAGKSTLFNRLTSGGAYAHKKLFATLSTRVEKWELGGGTYALVSDTVGFIRDLPHHLVASFRSTLEDAIFADLLIVVLDVSDPNAEMQLQTVFRTLDEIGANRQQRIILLNKVDQLERSVDLLPWLNQYPDAVPVSAATGEGVEDLAALVHEQVIGDSRMVDVQIALRDAAAIDFIEKRAEVQSRDYNADHVKMTVRLGRRQVQQLLARGSSLRINGMPASEALVTVWKPQETAPEPPRIPPHMRHVGAI